MSAISTLRGTIAAALTDNTAWQVFSFPPATPLANSIVVQPDDPILSQATTITNQLSLRLTLS